MYLTMYNDVYILYLFSPKRDMKSGYMENLVYLFFEINMNPVTIPFHMGVPLPGLGLYGRFVTIHICHKMQCEKKFLKTTCP